LTRAELSSATAEHKNAAPEILTARRAQTCAHHLPIYAPNERV